MHIQTKKIQTLEREKKKPKSLVCILENVIGISNIQTKNFCNLKNDTMREGPLYKQRNLNYFHGRLRFKVRDFDKSPMHQEIFTVLLVSLTTE